MQMKLGEMRNMAISNAMKKLSLASTGAAFIAVGSIQQVQAYTLFGDRTAFQSQLATFLIDDYSDPGYQRDSPITILSNAEMSNVFGETQYMSTGFDNLNIITNNNNGTYCTGCNGSFLLDFTKTSVGSTLGVFGAGFDITAGTDYFAHVTFGDNSTQDFSLAGRSFFGITSDTSIKTFHIGLQGGQTTTSGYIEIDKLTIGSNKLKSVPEPASVLGILALGAFMAGNLLKRKMKRKESLTA
jgi:hypothetical protein